MHLKRRGRPPSSLMARGWRPKGVLAFSGNVRDRRVEQSKVESLLDTPKLDPEVGTSEHLEKALSRRPSALVGRRPGSGWSGVDVGGRSQDNRGGHEDGPSCGGHAASIFLPPSHRNGLRFATPRPALKRP